VIRKVLAVAVALCAVQVIFADAPTRAKLDSCITFYQDGDYQRAVDSLKALLPFISDRQEEADAYKYLGFSYVMLEMIDKAKEFFRVALDKFPQMVIDTLEVPPNITVVFKQTKLESQMEKGEILDKKVQDIRQRRWVLGTALGITGLFSGAAGAYFVGKGFESKKRYDNYLPPAGHPPVQDSLERYDSDRRREFLIGGILSGVACANVSAALYLFLKKETRKQDRAHVYFGINRMGLAWSF
jgi:tetratricopeptide (TPR) repeat protein